MTGHFSMSSGPNRNQEIDAESLNWQVVGCHSVLRAGKFEIWYPDCSMLPTAGDAMLLPAPQFRICTMVFRWFPVESITGRRNLQAEAPDCRTGQCARPKMVEFSILAFAVFFRRCRLLLSVYVGQITGDLASCVLPLSTLQLGGRKW